MDQITLIRCYINITSFDIVLVNPYFFFRAKNYKLISYKLFIKFYNYLFVFIEHR